LPDRCAGERSVLSSGRGGTEPAEGVSMRHDVREILRLKFECGRFDRAIAVAVSVARSTVQLCLSPVCRSGAELATVTEYGMGDIVWSCNSAYSPSAFPGGKGRRIGPTYST
jgi:hypothetical protein